METLTAVVPGLATALGCGLLVGIERERRKADSPAGALAGVRTFAAVALMGAGAQLTEAPGLVAVAALLVAGLGVVSHYRSPDDDPGATTEVALMLTYVIGVLSVAMPLVAAGLAVTLTAMLAARDRLHHFARVWLQPAEVRDGIILAALVLIALPLVPDRPLWGPVLNPFLILKLLALLLAIQALAHVARRLLRAHHALALSAVASGFVSSTATIASYGLMVRQQGAPARRQAGGAVLSCVATLLQLVLIAAAVAPSWVQLLWLPCLLGGLCALIYGLWLVWSSPAESAGQAQGAASESLFSLKGAALIAALLTGIQAAVYGLGQWLGDAGLVLMSALSAVFELHAAMAAVMSQGSPDQGVLLTALMVGLGVHALSKTINAALSGGLAYAGWAAPGIWLHTVVAVLLVQSVSASV